MSKDQETCITKCRIVGIEYRPIYDNHPYLGTYQKRVFKAIYLKKMTLEDVKQLLQPQYLLDIWYNEEGYIFQEEDELNSVMKRLELFDNDTNLVAEACLERNGAIQWIEEVSICDAGIIENEKIAGNMEKEAAIEDGLGNYSSAENLREAEGVPRREISTERYAAEAAIFGG